VWLGRKYYSIEGIYTQRHKFMRFSIVRFSGSEDCPEGRI
jgi:hypothetical protein